MSMTAPQISGCSSASVRPRPHSTACAGLARSPSVTGWALRVNRNSFGGNARLAAAAGHGPSGIENVIAQLSGVSVGLGIRRVQHVGGGRECVEDGIGIAGHRSRRQRRHHAGVADEPGDLRAEGGIGDHQPVALRPGVRLRGQILHGPRQLAEPLRGHRAVRRQCPGSRGWRPGAAAQRRSSAGSGATVCSAGPCVARGGARSAVGGTCGWRSDWRGTPRCRRCRGPGCRSFGVRI